MNWKDGILLYCYFLPFKLVWYSLTQNLSLLFFSVYSLRQYHLFNSGHRKMFQRSLWQQQCIVQLWDPNPRSKVSFICFTVIEFCRRQGINMKSQEKAWRYIWGPWGLHTLDIYPISIGNWSQNFPSPKQVIMFDAIKRIVHIFWEGNKILRNLHLTFVLCSASQKQGEDFAKFCGLLRIYELYYLFYCIIH